MKEEKAKKSTAEKVAIWSHRTFSISMFCTIALSIFGVKEAIMPAILIPIIFLPCYTLFCISLKVYWKFIKKQAIPEWFAQMIKSDSTYEPARIKSFATDPRFSSCVTNVFHRR